jgi:DNA-binding Xre family transcriptional regulator
MNIQTLRLRLHEVNLSRLAAEAGVALRTLRRLKNDPDSSITTKTLERIEAGLRKVRRSQRSAA